jgi:hypothetical protein
LVTLCWGAPIVAVLALVLDHYSVRDAVITYLVAWGLWMSYSAAQQDRKLTELQRTLHDSTRKKKKRRES